MSNATSVFRRIGGSIATALPLASAAIFAATFARDALELASAAIAVGSVLSLAGLAQLASLRRTASHLCDRQDETRAQALALARCMKVLNARLSDLEQARGGAAPSISPASSPPARPDDGRRPLFLADGAHLWGHEQELSPSPGWGPDRRLCAALLAVATSNDRGGVLVRAPDSLTALPHALALASALVAADPEFAARFRLGLRQSVLRAPGEATALARLATAGVRMALTDMADARVDPHALKACSIVAVAPEPGSPLPAGLAEALGQAGVEVIVPESAPVPVLMAEAATIIPWRAAPGPGLRRGLMARLRRFPALDPAPGDPETGDRANLAPLRASA